MLTDDDIKALSGLTTQEAKLRLDKEGANELPSADRESLWHMVWHVAQEPMMMLLMACGVVYVLIGTPRDAVMLLCSVFVVMGITLYQNRKTANALAALRNLSSPRALVIRDGTRKRIAGREVVRGDNLVLNEGDRVPADAILRWAQNVYVDESLLTGEAVPVRKRPGEMTPSLPRPGGDDLPTLYSGTLIVRGHGIAEVVHTGERTELGLIGGCIDTTKDKSGRLKTEMGHIVKRLSLVGAVLCVIVLLVFGFTRHQWLEGILAGLTLAIAILPEEFPVVLTVTLALGAWRMSKYKVLARRPGAIEALGSINVLCVDKTGTLTENRMTVAQLSVQGRLHNAAIAGTLPADFHELVEYGILASQSEPFDPMEKALGELGQRTLHDTEHLHGDWSLIREYPLSAELLAMSHVWRAPDGKKAIIAAKGAPEAIIDLCHLSEDAASEVARNVERMAKSGARVLGVAKAQFSVESLPTEQHAFEFTFLGLIGLEDPIRPQVGDAIAQCDNAGIRVVMITGDHPTTAKSIAQKAGFKNTDAILLGTEIDAMSQEALSKRLSDVQICSRVLPEQKLRIVKALQTLGYVVAMTGDGVNDAPALSAAEVGISMGQRGTDVAREASDIVVLDDNFSSIVEGISQGRRIYDNLRKSIMYLLSVHVPIAGLSLVPVIAGWPMLLLPVHVLMLELIIDPACSIVFEREPAEHDVMSRPPRPSGEPLFNTTTLLISIAQGAWVLIVLVALTAWCRNVLPQFQVRSVAFAALICANIGLIVANRSRALSTWKKIISPNRVLWLVALGAFLALGCAIYLPVMSALFQMEAISFQWLGVAIAVGLSAPLLSDVVIFSRFILRPAKNAGLQ